MPLKKIAKEPRSRHLRRRHPEHSYGSDEACYWHLLEARRILVEAAWSYRYPSRVANDKAEILVRLPKAVQEIACANDSRMAWDGHPLRLAAAA